MAELQEYKCPCCGGSVEFDSNTQRMKCPYCDTEFDVDNLKKYDEGLSGARPDDLSWDSGKEPGQEWTESDGVRTYVCESCGGEIIAEETTAATQCPFCGNNVIMRDQVSGGLKPDTVIPFKLDKEAAKQAFAKHLTGKKLLPAVFRSESQIDEIKGIYVPMWLYDTEAFAQMRFTATKVHTHSDSRYRYTDTEHWDIQRGGTLSFANVPADGSRKMPDDLMDSLEPFDLTAAVDFQTAYLSGYLADKYDVSSDECAQRANRRIQNSTEMVFTNEARRGGGYTTFTKVQGNIQLNRNTGRIRYALFPVWLMSATWKGKRYQFAMNGQTGKFVGNLPIDYGAYWKYFGITAGIAAAAVYILLTAAQYIE